MKYVVESYNTDVDTDWEWESEFDDLRAAFDYCVSQANQTTTTMHRVNRVFAQTVAEVPPLMLSGEPS